MVAGAVARCVTELVEPDDLVLPLAARRSDRPAVPGASLAELERYAIRETFDATGSTARAAELLRIRVRTVQSRLHACSVRRARA